MNQDKDSDQPIERTLGEAWRQQPVPEPSEAWHEQVMAAIAAEPAGPHIVKVAIQTGLAWRAACVTAAAAVIVTSSERAADMVARGEYGFMVAARGDGTQAVPLAEVAGKVKLVPPDHDWVTAARKVGTSLGD